MNIIMHALVNNILGLDANVKTPRDFYLKDTTVDEWKTILDN